MKKFIFLSLFLPVYVFGQSQIVNWSKRAGEDTVKNQFGANVGPLVKFVTFADGTTQTTATAAIDSSIWAKKWWTANQYQALGEDYAIGAATGTSLHFTSTSGEGGWLTKPAGWHYIRPVTLTDTMAFGIVRAALQDTGQVCNVKAYGAKGDGATDDYAAITAAISQAKQKAIPLYFPSGTYKISSPIYLNDWSNAIILGDGPRKSIIRITVNDSDAIKEQSTSITYNFVIKNIGITAPTGSNGTGINLSSSSVKNAPLFENIYISDFGRGIFTRYCDYPVFIHVMTQRCDTGWVLGTATNSTTGIGCSFAGSAPITSGTVGVYCVDADAFVLSGSEFGQIEQGIRADANGLKQGMFIGVRMESVSVSFVTLTTARASFRECTFFSDNTLTPMITLATSGYYSFDGIEVTQQPADGVFISADPGCIVSIRNVVVASGKTKLAWKDVNYTSDRDFMAGGIESRDIVVANPDSVGLFNYVRNDKNLNRSTQSQATDTSSIAFSFTASGKPKISVTGITGNKILNIDSIGNVGIGTATPARNLHVKGNTGGVVAKFEANATSGYLDIVTTSTSVSAGGVRFIAATTDEWIFGSNYADGGKFGIATGATLGSGHDKVTISQTGNLGIGAVNLLHKQTTVSSTGTNLNAFNFVDTDINTNSTTVAQAIDTSSVNMVFSSTGEPTLSLVGKIGNVNFRSDSITTTVNALKIGGSAFAQIDSAKVVGNYLKATIAGVDYFAKKDTASLSPDSSIWAKKWWTANQYQPIGTYLVPSDTGSLLGSKSWLTNQYSPLGHLHSISQVTGNQDSLTAKLNRTEFLLARMPYLQDSLTAKLNRTEFLIARMPYLQDSLTAKWNRGETIGMSQIVGVQDSLNNKQNRGEDYAIGSATGDTLNVERIVIRMSDGTPTIRIHSNNILNTFVGLASGLVNDPSAGGNAALGTYSLQSNTTGACLTSVGAYSLEYNTQGDYNSAFGMAALRQTIAASYNSGFGAYALNANITGANNLALGYRAGQYATDLSNRLYINSLNRTNLLGDTTLSIIYGYQAATAAGQRLYLNANTYISGAVSADSVILSHLKIGGSGSVIDSAKVVGNYLDATVGSVNYFARNDTTSAVSKADSALMPGYATRTQFAADTTYKAALIASKQNTIANLADTSKYVEGGEFAADTLYKASLAATKVAKADSALMPGYATRTQFAADTTYKAAQIATKEPTITAGTTTQYWRGDKSWQTYVPGITGWSTAKRTADTTTSTATLKNVGLAFSVVSGHYYKFKFVLLYSTGATTTGIKVALTCPAVTDFSAGVKIFGFAVDAAAGAWMGVINSSGDVVTSTGVAVIDVHYTAEVEGIIVPSADGVLQLQWASETTAAATLKAGSMGEIYEY